MKCSKHERRIASLYSKKIIKNEFNMKKIEIIKRDKLFLNLDI